MSEANPTELETTVINMAALILDLMVASGTVPTHVLVRSIDQLGAEMVRRGYGQSAGHMIHFREFLQRREGERAAAQSLLKEQPAGKA